ncbi:hypothetical protein INR49_007062 [Caranx melampygus]|nr:hypothetical protein INR49_007062 [Caranx melampygus]
MEPCLQRKGFQLQTLLSSSSSSSSRGPKLNYQRCDETAPARFCSSAADSASSIIRSHHKPLSEASYSSHATPRTGKHQLTFRSPPESSTFWLSCPWSCCSFRWRLQCFAESWRRRRSASGRQHTLFSLGGNYSTHNPSAAAQPVALPGARPVEPWETRSSSDSCEQ